MAGYAAIINRLNEYAGAPVEEILGAALAESGYRESLEQSESEDDLNRLANIEELLTDARQFDEQDEAGGGLEAYLENAWLVNETDRWEEDVDKVTLMTLHAAKGLEFPVVYLIALEQGLIPHERSMNDEAQLEEERRLAFVGITRAEDELQMSIAERRDFRGQRRFTAPSLFLLEMPRDEMEVVNLQPQTSSYPEDWDDLDDEQSFDQSAEAWSDHPEAQQVDAEESEVAPAPAAVTTAAKLAGSKPVPRRTDRPRRIHARHAGDPIPSTAQAKSSRCRAPARTAARRFVLQRPASANSSSPTATSAPSRKRGRGRLSERPFGRSAERPPSLIFCLSLVAPRANNAYITVVHRLATVATNGRIARPTYVHLYELGSMSAGQPKFVFVACQHGAEGVLKSDVATRHPTWRFAFSRPGFVTYKLTDEAPSMEEAPCASPFARTSGWSLGRIEAERIGAAAAAVWELESIRDFLKSKRLCDVHVWQRDPALPGEHGFEPGVTPLSREVDAAIRDRCPAAVKDDLAAEPVPATPRRRWVLDVAMVEPNQWWIGGHYTASRSSRWPGGVPSLTMPEYALARAYLKMSEALLWSALPVNRGDWVIELGSAPGGSAQALIDRHLLVIGVDPAEMPAELTGHPNFTHIRRRASELPRRTICQAKWLAADMNVPPQQTIDDVQTIVDHHDCHIRGLLLTLKLAEWKLVEDVPAWIAQIQSWGFRDVRIRQLAFNRRELCVLALRSRGQRRVRRKSTRASASPRVR